jgi:acyl-coenzyme A synthetase/AMP-(fatty) acid ligase
MGPRAFTFDAGTGEYPQAFLTENPATPVPIGMSIEGIKYKIENDELLILSPYQSINFASDFFATSDRADLTSVGVRVHGRMDFTIIKSGINIYPTEVEALLTEFSEVIDCALIPQKSESYGQVPVLLLYTMSTSDDLIARVTEHLKINLPSAHLPSRIVLRNKDFPRTSMGKIKVNALIEEMENEQS